MIQYVAYSTSGVIQAMNEDNFYVNGCIKSMNKANFLAKGKNKKNKNLFAVCDGLGGEKNGEEAAFMAVQLLKKYQNSFYINYMEYLDEINKKILQKQKENQSTLACTFTALSIENDKLKSVNIGDSRAYILNSNGFTCLTKDHTEFSTMVQYGVLNPDDYYISPFRNNLTRVLGDEREQLEPYVHEDVSLKQDDILMICSDGLCGVMREKEIVEFLREEISLYKKCKRIVKRALELGSEDNITVILIKI